jgi:hypothetical protein
MSEHASSPYTPEEITHAFQSGDIPVMCRTLVTLSLADSDWRKVQTYCLEFLEYHDDGVRMVAATCIGHLARIHKQLDLDLVLPALYRHQSDPGRYVAGTVDNALSCIERFMDVPVTRDPAMRGAQDSVLEFEEDDGEDDRLLTQEEVEQAFQSGDSTEISRTLFSLASLDPDWQKVEAYCLAFLDNPDEEVRDIAVRSLNRLVYLHEKLDLDLVLPALYRLRTDPSPDVVRHVNFALDDIASIMNVPIHPPISSGENANNDTRVNGGLRE